MIKPVLLVAASALALTACGSSSGNADSKAAESAASAIRSEVSALGSGASGGASSSASGTDAKTVDVCALLSQADAVAVAQADMLDPAGTASTAYTFTAAKPDDDDGSSACRFSMSDGTREGTVLFETQPGSAIDEYTDGTKVPGLGDEAYTNENGGTVVRVGDVLLTEGDDSFGSQITLDLLRKMAPHLR